MASGETQGFTEARNALLPDVRWLAAPQGAWRRSRSLQRVPTPTPGALQAKAVSLHRQRLTAKLWP